MKYIKKFNNDTERSKYIKSNFVSPHLFLETQNKSLKTFPKYKRLDYISSTKTGGQYIDLGCHLMENTDDIRIDIKFNIKDRGLNSSNQQGALICSQPEVSPYPGFVLRYMNNNSTKLLHLQAKWNFTNSTEQKTSGKWDSNYLSTRNQTCLDNTMYEFSETLDNIPQSQINNCTCILFCAYDSSNVPFRFVEADLYYLRLYKGGQLVRNLIPVQRQSDGEVGLWDLEHQVFYASQSTESFVAGINYDHEILYLESSGQQWINLDYKVWNHGLKGELVIQRLDDATDTKAYIGRSSSSGFDLFTSGKGKFNLWIHHYEGDLYISSNDTDTIDKNIHNIMFDINENEILYLKIDDEEYSKNYVKDNNGTANIQLFSHRGYYNTTGRIYSCKLWYNDVMIYDLIPVRKNGIGYMFNKLNSQLYGDSSGNNVPFILGPDV